ncbi:hypothetical protein CTAYLR_010632 [Chrysophaeum taylorii]|uniref:Thioredoxin domain-containing protein n=1 Tax=Chrysophaeum taylorii TaxID=2483200 RepID=A0AAD7UDZ0_9STRA|nr:hypothetical protein CTAYLR_010632 [Chrysophaeum taylorii]
MWLFLAVLLAEGALVQELKFAADAVELTAGEDKGVGAGLVVVLGLFGPTEAKERAVFEHVMVSDDFVDGGWVAAWSSESRVRNHLQFETPTVRVYRPFGPPEAFASDWDYRELKHFVWSSSFAPVSTFPTAPSDAPEADDDEPRVVVDRNKPLNLRLHAALRQFTVPTFAVLLNREEYFNDREDEHHALRAFGKKSKGAAVVLLIDPDNPIAEPVAKLGGLDLAAVRESERPSGVFFGHHGSMPFDGLYYEEALDWALSDFYEQGAGGSTTDWERPKGRRRPVGDQPSKKSTKKTKRKKAPKPDDLRRRR